MEAVAAGVMATVVAQMGMVLLVVMVLRREATALHQVDMVHQLGMGTFSDGQALALMAIMRGRVDVSWCSLGA